MSKSTNEVEISTGNSKSAVDALVSLHITDDTELTQKANMFADGKDGYFMQKYSIFADGNDTGVTMLVTGNMGKNNTKSIFGANGNDYDKVKDALEAAGHKWERAD